jgi:hypothetical protein
MSYEKPGRHKLHNLTGLISLTLLIPAIFLYYNYRYGIFIDVPMGKTLAAPGKENYWQILLPPDRDCLKFSLTGDEAADNAKLNRAKKRMKELIAANDTLRCIQFEFGSKASYQSFITAIDICDIEKPDMYATYKNSIYAINYSVWEEKEHTKLWEAYLKEMFDDRGSQTLE